jgi:hypothetical protein
LGKVVRRQLEAVEKTEQAQDDNNRAYSDG